MTDAGAWARSRVQRALIRVGRSRSVRRRLVHRTFSFLSHTLQVNTTYHSNVRPEPEHSYAAVLTLPIYRHSGSRTRQTGFDIDGDELHYPTRPVDKDKAEAELVINIKKATSPEESAPKQKHVRSMRC
jgi:hypothetical protein